MYDYQNILHELDTRFREIILKDKDLQEHIQKRQLDKEEIEMMIEGEQKGLILVENTEEEKQQLIEVAKNTIKGRKTQKQPITVRLSTYDLNGLKEKASRLGMPYQTLLSSLVHQYVTGQEIRL